MRPTCKIDNRNLVVKVARFRTSRVEARRASVVDGVDVFMSSVAANAPRDTNRYVASVLQAGRDVGVVRHPIPAVVASKGRERYLERLKDQADTWAAKADGYAERIADIEAKLKLWFDDRGRKRGKGARKMASAATKMQRSLEKARKYATRAAEELAKATGDPTALIIYGSSGKIGKRGRRVGYRLHTARVGVYGGRGTIINTPDRTVVEIRSMEPHARIVEKRHQVFARATMAAGSTGVRRMHRKYVAAVAKGTGLGGGGGGGGKG